MMMAVVMCVCVCVCVRFVRERAAANARLTVARYCITWSE
jgi:hypothetical protein|eukprot:COSAG01_NODE_3907_length_5556_cov_8.827378_8_plen_40_part_00